MSLEMHKNEVHLLLSIGFKMHLYSFIEHQLGWKKTLMVYFFSGISGTAFQCILNN
jgi:membrane associated rhomboid family serine protease